MRPCNVSSRLFDAGNSKLIPSKSMTSETYHRTFLPDGPFESYEKAHGIKEKPAKGPQIEPTSPNAWQQIATGQGTARRPTTPLPPGYKPFTPFSPGPNVAPVKVFNSPSGSKPYSRTQARINVLQITPTDDLNRIWVVEKADQKFSMVATPWEQRFSKFANPTARKYEPFVDSSLRVVGYIGTLRDSDVYIPAGTMENRFASKFPNNFDNTDMISEIRPPGYVQFGFWDPKYIYSVITDIEGYIVAAEYLDTTANVEAIDNPDPKFLLGVFRKLITRAVISVGAVRGKGLLNKLMSRRGFGANSTGGKPPAGGKPPVGAGVGSTVGGGATGSSSKIIGVPEGIGDAALREKYAVMRLDQAGTVNHIYYDQAARQHFGIAKVGVKYPDVTGTYPTGGGIALAEAKGNSAEKAVIQLESAGKYHKNIRYQEIIVSHTKQLKHPDGGVIQVVGPNLATGPEFGWRLMNVSSWPPSPRIVNGIEVRVVVMNQPESHFPLPK